MQNSVERLERERICVRDCPEYLRERAEKAGMDLWTMIERRNAASVAGAFDIPLSRYGISQIGGR